jgi:hypothetical protein
MKMIIEMPDMAVVVCFCKKPKKPPLLLGSGFRVLGLKKG